MPRLRHRAGPLLQDNSAVKSCCIVHAALPSGFSRRLPRVEAAPCAGYVPGICALHNAGFLPPGRRNAMPQNLWRGFTLSFCEKKKVCKGKSPGSIAAGRLLAQAARPKRDHGCRMLSPGSSPRLETGILPLVERLSASMPALDTKASCLSSARAASCHALLSILL